MTGTRILVVILVAMAALFVFGLYLGAHNQAGAQTDTQQTWVQRFGENLVPQVDLTTVSGACLNAPNKTFVLASTTMPCSVTIPKSAHIWQAVRRITLHRVSGADISISYDGMPGENSDLPDPKSSPDHDTKSFLILKQGGTLTLSCRSSAPCQVQVQ